MYVPLPVGVALSTTLVEVRLEHVCSNVPVGVALSTTLEVRLEEFDSIRSLMKFY